MAPPIASQDVAPSPSGSPSPDGHTKNDRLGERKTTHRGNDKSSHGCRPGNLTAEYLQQVMVDMPGRCDLNSLLRSDKQYQVELREQHRCYRPRYHPSKLPHTTVLCKSALKHGISVEAMLTFVWHKTLQVFAGGEQSVLLVSDYREEILGDGRGLHRTSLMNHAKTVNEPCVNIIRCLDMQVGSYEFKAAEFEDLKVGFFDSHITFEKGTDKENTVLHYLTASFFFSPGQPNRMLFACAEDFFSATTAESLLREFRLLLDQIIQEPQVLAAELNLVDVDQTKLLDLWNATDGDYDRSARLEDLFEQAVAAVPRKTAVIYGDNTLSFTELNEEADRLGNYLWQTIRVTTEQVVALFLDKSEHMIATVLGVWKAGACYSPIDPTYPDARVRFSIEDTGAQIILTSARHAQRVRALCTDYNGITILELEPLLTHLRGSSKNMKFNRADGLRSDQLCYITYTSGTTGIPKGIKKRHTNVINSITDLANRYNMKTDQEVVVLFSPYVFEPFARQTLMALLNGQTLLVVNDEEKLDPVAFPMQLRKHRVTYLNGTASVLQEFDYSSCPDLKRLVLVGEDLTKTRYDDLRRKFNKRIINEYGFTESAFVTAIKIFEPQDPRPNRSLGRPLRNVKCYVLGHNLRRVPVGAIGVLYIGGQGVSEGYLNRAELTKERFLTNPYQTADERAKGFNSVIYCTGDLARWIPETQEIEYLGRNDFQIKLRGIRIEPGEIESVLANRPGVERAVVMAKSVSIQRSGGATSTKHLIGYWTGDSSLHESTLIDYLGARLPRYMVPTRLVHLHRIPTTINGKVDFRALPEADRRERISTLPPCNKMQLVLCDIWSQVLGLPKSVIGRRENFFRLGGNSVSCIQLIGRVLRELDLHLTVEEIFAEKTIERLDSLLNRKRELKPKKEVCCENQHLDNKFIAALGNVEAHYAANSLQQGFFYHYQKHHRDDNAYIMQYVCNYHREIDPNIYREAWAAAQANYSSLRLRFAVEDGVYQIIQQTPDLEFHYCNSSEIATNDSFEGNFALLQDKDRDKSYKLDEGSLFRVYLVRCARFQYRLLFSCHHAILDGWSIPILLDFVHEVYVKLHRGVSLAVKSDSAQFKAAQTHVALAKDKDLEYWRERVDQIQERNDLRGLIRPDIRYDVNLTTYDSIKMPREITTEIDEDLKNEIEEICKNHGVTLHSILQFVCHKTLNIYGNGRHSVVGTIVSGRNLPVDNIESAVGLFINTLPLIVDHQEQRSHTVIQAIRGLQGDVVCMNMRSSAELGKLASRKMAHELFDCLFVLENYPEIDRDKHEMLQRELLIETHGSSEKLTYPLAFVCSEVNSKLKITLRFASELFEEDTIGDILDVFKTVLSQIPFSLDRPVRDLNQVSNRQMEQLAAWNSSDVEYPQCTLSELFEKVAATCPEKVAIAYENLQLSYEQLDEETTQLACYLKYLLQSQPDQIVALILKKNIEMFITILAIWKAGMAYCPIDPSFPEERIKYILEETSAVAVICNESLMHKVPQGVKPPKMAVEQILIQARQQKHGYLTTCATNTNLAYIYFTSGTTGKPKGVMIEHRGVINLQQALCNIFELKTEVDEVLLSFSNYTFDHFVEQMTDALLNGQTLLVLNDEMRADKDRLYRYMKDYQVTYLSGTPSVISMYDYGQFPWLRRIDCVGEDFSEPVFNKIRKTFGGMIINGYGPTEVSITTHKRLYMPGERRSNKSIGSQVHNSRTYVLDHDMKQVPVGAIGELYLGGDGVGRGYLNRYELTQTRFPMNPFQSKADKAIGRDGRLYKTGDLVRWLPSGEIEYLGRDDFQIKLRGQRVELGEIEAAITSCTSVVQSVVVPHTRAIPASNGTQKFLVGYYVSNECIAEPQMKLELREKLPEHLIPNRVVRVDILPVTVSGKLDTKSLPPVDYSTAAKYVPPNNSTEVHLCSIWADLLGVNEDSISVLEDFFSLGGDSLSSTKLAFTITREFTRRITVADVFQNRTVRALAHHLQHSASGAGLGFWPAPEIQEFSASLSQQRFLFIDKFVEGSCAYNVPKYLLVPQDCGMTMIRKVFEELVTRHSALRTFLVISPTTALPTQKILDAKTAIERFPIREVNVNTQQDLHTVLDIETRHEFALSAEIPIRAVIICENETGRRILALNFHHIAVDAWSWDIIKHELSVVCQQNTAPLERSMKPQLGISYASYSAWQHENLKGERGKVLESYWLKQLEGFNSTNLRTDYVRPREFDYNGCDWELELPLEIIVRTEHIAQSLKISTFSIFMGAFCLLLSTYTNQSDIVIGMPVANRHHPEIENVVGCFINLVALRMQVNLSDTQESFLRAINSAVLEAQLYQDYPIEELVRALQVDHSPGRHPIFQHVFSSDVISRDKSARQHHKTQNVLQEYNPCQKIYSSSKFDLSTTITQRGGQTIVNFNWPIALFHGRTIERFAQTYHNILLNLIDSDRISCTLRDISLVKPLEEFASSKTLGTTEPQEKSLGELFQEQVCRVPRATAIVCDFEKVSYQILEDRSNRMASYLQTIGTQMGELIGLMLEPSLDLIVCILAIWKIGAAYVPLDIGTALPLFRLRYILKDTSMTHLITRKRHAPRLDDTEVCCIDLDNEETQELIEKSPDPVLSPVSQESIAYCIYTSGTTGAPKGVLVPHKGVLLLVRDLKKRYFSTVNPQAQEAVLMTSNFVFDFSVEQIALSILSGHKLILLPNGITADDWFYSYTNREQLTYISGTPSVLARFDMSRLQHLKMVTCAGEQLQPSQFNAIRSKFSGPVNNAYGTTETTIYNLVCQYVGDQMLSNDIGEPIAGSRVYIADSELRLLPPGAVGELYISGESVAPGYLNRAELTSSRFLTNPFLQIKDEAHKIVYRTGDLVRRSFTGQLEFLGRKDQQVKLRGYRIELEEIQTALAGCPGVEECAVLTESHGQKVGNNADFIIGYYVSRHELSHESLHSSLAARLPLHSIPAHFVFVPKELPITVQGKLDIAGLPSVKDTEVKPTRPPRDTREANMCSLWSDFLATSIGIDDDFFRRGGDSIMSLQLVQQMREQMGCKVSVKDVFECRTIARLSHRLSGSDGASSVKIKAEQGILSGPVKLLPIQCWFFDKSLNHRSHWNQTFLVHTHELELDRLQKAYGALQAHHDAFRLSFSVEGLDILQRYEAETCNQPIVELSNSTSTEVSEQLTRLQQSLDISRGRVAAVAYLRNGEDHTIWFALHHLVTDVVSWKIIARDLQNLYNGGDLQAKGTSYRQWAAAMSEHVMSDNEEQYWETIAQNCLRSYDTSILRELRANIIVIPEEHAEVLSKSVQFSVQEVLLTVLSRALKGFLELGSVVTMESHGRDHLDPSLDVSNTVGWFTSMYPFVLPFDDNISKHLQGVRSSLAAVPNRGVMYGNTYGYGALPPITFNYLGRQSKLQEGGEWRVEQCRNPEWGTARSELDADANTAILDVTAWLEGPLFVQLDSRLDESTAKLLSTRMRASLSEVVDFVNFSENTPESKVSGVDRVADNAFVPFFQFDSPPRHGPRLFLLPPGEGGAESYFNNIVSYMPNTPLVVFNNVHLHNPDPESSFQSLARQYIHWMRQVQPHGPYNLLGWSFGGVLALEVCLQIITDGQKVTSLTFIDSYFDVKSTSTAIGHPDDVSILDPINWYYRPDKAALALVPRLVQSILLFKAGIENDRACNSRQKRLFDWYQSSCYNGLDSWLDPGRIRTAILDEESHYSWVGNVKLLESISSLVKSSIG